MKSIFNLGGLSPKLIALLILGVYYVLVGYALARFVFASYTNAIFDKFVNSHIEGAQVNRGLAQEEDLDDDDEDEDDPVDPQ